MATGEIGQVDDILCVLGNPGRFQVLQFVVLAYQYIPLAMNDFMPIFYGLAPLAVRCIEDGNNLTTIDTHFASGKEEMVAKGNGTNPEPVCNCPNGFAYEYSGKQWSIIGDMDLVCDRAVLVNIASVIYFFGQMLATPIFGWSADKFGRRPTLLFSNFLYTILTVGLVFSRDYTSFVLLRFFIGVARQGMNSSFFVLMMEWIPPNRRGTWAALAELMYTFGVLFITLMAFLLQNWIHIQVFLAVCTLLSIPLYWFAPESLTWLCLHKRVDEVLATCNKVAKFNKIKISDSTIRKIKRYAETSATRENSAKMYSFVDCWRTPNIRKVTVLCCFSWLSCYFGYLGLSYLSSEIASNVYLNLAINGLLEFIPILLAYGIASRFGNKKPLVIYFLIGGICSIVAGSIPGHTRVQVMAQNVMAFLGRMSFVGVCCVIFVFTSELFPTVIRNNGFSLCSIALRIGCVITPLLPLMSTSVYKGSGFMLVGIVAIFASGASSLLRETKGKPMPNTIEDAETLGSGVRLMLPKGLRMRRKSHKEDREDGVCNITQGPLYLSTPMSNTVQSE